MYIIAILIVLICFLLESFIAWGIGVAVCSTFNINYAWTFWHGAVVTMVLGFVGSFLRSTNNNK